MLTPIPTDQKMFEEMDITREISSTPPGNTKANNAEGREKYDERKAQQIQVASIESYSFSSESIKNSFSSESLKKLKKKTQAEIIECIFGTPEASKDTTKKIE